MIVWMIVKLLFILTVYDYRTEHQFPLMNRLLCRLNEILHVNDVKCSTRVRPVMTTSSLFTVATPWTAACQTSCPWDFPGENTGVGCHALLQGIFPTQGLNPHHLCPALEARFFTAAPPGNPSYGLTRRSKSVCWRQESWWGLSVPFICLKHIIKIQSKAFLSPSQYS